MRLFNSRYVHLLTLLMLTCLAGSARAQTNQVEIKVTARQFEFSPRIITVHKGDHVKLILASEDVPHGFKIDELKIDKHISADRRTSVEFTADREGRFKFYCSVFCGDGHDKMVGELVVVGAESPSSNIHVSFDKTEPSVVIVEAAGERIRIDTRDKSVSRLAAPEPTLPGSENASGEVAAEQETRGKAHPPEPYDYRLVNIPTPKRVPRHSLNVYFTHRFSEEVTATRGEPGEEHRDRIAEDLLGLDSGSVSSFGVFYGITDHLYASAYRSPLCQPGICKTIELGLGYHFLDEAGKSPVALSVEASITGENNFTERYTENIQVMVARSVTRYAHVFFSPAVHINANGQGRFNPRSSDFFPPEPLADTVRLGQHTGSFGFGADGRIRPSVSLIFEFTPRVGFKQGSVVPVFDSTLTHIIGFKNRSEPEIGIGIQKRIGRHSFTLILSNTQTTTTNSYNSSNLFLPPNHFVIGFNLFRRLL
jgi:cytochrome c oxidase subunit 2